MSLIGNLDSDFGSFMLTDWGESITVKSISSQSFNPSSGDNTTVEASDSITAIVETINRKEVELDPNKFRTSDTVFRFQLSALTNVSTIAINDTITYSGNDYKIIDFSLTKGIYKVFARKAE